MKRIGIVLLGVGAMIGAMGSWAMAQPSYRSQLETALGGTIVGVQRTTKFPPSSLTQVVDFTVNHGGGRTEVLPVEVVIVKSGTGYAVQRMSLLKTSTAMMATQRAASLPTPSAETMGGGGSGGGTGTTTRPSTSTSDECKKKCFTNPTGGPIDWVKATACYLACLLGVPNFLSK